MNRPIKFRAWVKEEVKRRKNIRGATYDTFTIDEMMRPHHYRFDEYDLWEQFTGLFDKNGVEIYEGDILWGDRIVRWGEYNEGVGFYLEEVGVRDFGNGPVHDTHTLFAFTTPFEVIGNIYENPELLGGKDD